MNLFFLPFRKRSVCVNRHDGCCSLSNLCRLSWVEVHRGGSAWQEPGATAEAGRCRAATSSSLATRLLLLAWGAGRKKRWLRAATGAAGLCAFQHTGLRLVTHVFCDSPRSGLRRHVGLWTGRAAKQKRDRVPVGHDWRCCALTGVCPPARNMPTCVATLADLISARFPDSHLLLLAGSGSDYVPEAPQRPHLGPRRQQLQAGAQGQRHRDLRQR